MNSKHTDQSATDRDGTKAAGRPFTWHVFVLAITAVISLFSRFFHPSFYGFFEDDFFYYALVAKHLVISHLSTFDGTHLTNGYHPLWLLVVALCYALFPGIGFFLAIQSIAFAAILFFYFGTLRSLKSLQIPPPLGPLAALALSTHALLLLRYGMEVTLALPLGVWTLSYILDPKFRWSIRQTFVYGLFASLTILARLDSVLLLALVITAQTVTAGRSWPVRFQRIGVFCLGCFPLLVYLFLNLHFFHALLPVSGSAKQLKPLWPPSSAPLMGFFLPVDRNKAAFVYPATCVILFGLTVFLRGLRSSPRPTQRQAILGALFVFPFVHIGVLSLLSDWTIWPWYYYSLSYALLAATVTLLCSPSTFHARSYGVAKLILHASTLYLVIYLASYSFFKKPLRESLYFTADFAKHHPGAYAMGDGAGTPAFLADQPVIQLEGLVMDAEYLQLVRQRTPLRDVLTRYHADYYVTIAGRQVGPCLFVSEPAQAGLHSPTMLGKVCSQPLATAREQGVQVNIYRASDVLLP